MEKKHEYYSKDASQPLNLPEDKWKELLEPEVFHIAREKGTERPFSGKFWNSKELGKYYCSACGNPLFTSDGKFESSCGWPSFFEPVNDKSIIFAPDNTFGMKRTEVMCGRCKAHLGHVFDDGPAPTNLRYCINSVSLHSHRKNKAAMKSKPAFCESEITVTFAANIDH